MALFSLLQPFGWALTILGIATLVIAGMLGTPLSAPPALASIHRGAMAIGAEGRPELSRFQARDGTFLAYRLYTAKDAAANRLALLVHGSSASAAAMHALARALAEGGVAAVAVDIRGHGASGTRGDIGYLGQLDDDLADLVAELRQTYPLARLTLAGHSSGGGFALRIASGPLAKLFGRFVLLAPYLGYAAPTNRPSEGASLWALADVPRIIAISLLRRVGIAWTQSLPVIAFAVAPEAHQYVTPRYSYRLLANFGAPDDWKQAFAAASAPIAVIAGDKDEMMFVDRYAEVLKPFAATTRVASVADADHIGILYQPAALAAIVDSVKQ